jgi:hypothetical protein
MDSLLDTVRRAIGPDGRPHLARILDADPNAVAAALDAALPLLLGAAAREAHVDDTSGNLYRAVAEDHRGGLLDHAETLLATIPDRAARGGLGALAPMVGSAMKGDVKARALDGRGILHHLFGDRLPALAEGVARMSGLERHQVRGLLEILAPLLLAALARAIKTSRLDAEGLGSFLNEERQSIEARHPQLGDGDLLDLLDGEGTPIVEDVPRLGETLREIFAG